MGMLMVTASSPTRNIIYLLAEKYLNVMFPETSCPHRNVISILLRIFMMMSIKLSHDIYLYIVSSNLAATF